MANIELFNNANYSDLTLKLIDGREIKVHKIILCLNNEYFNKLCGHNSNFAEAKMKVIQLKDDDPNALEHILRRIYGCPAPLAAERSWRFWLDVELTADKYLAPSLSVEASTAFRETYQEVRGADDIFDIMETVSGEVSHSKDLQEFVEKLRKDNIVELLKNEKYRAFLDADRERLWAQVDEMLPNLVPAGAVKKRNFSCVEHEQDIMVDGEQSSAKRPCCMCVAKRRAGACCTHRVMVDLPQYEGCDVYIAK